MMRFSALVALGLVWIALSGMPLQGRDLIVLKTGESLNGEVETITDVSISFTLPRLAEAAEGTARRTIPASEVDYIEFGVTNEEKEVYEQRAVAAAAILKTWWEYTLPHLHRPRSRTALWGVAYADAILREDPEGGSRRALGIFDLIINRAWSPEDVAEAQRGRLRALIAGGDLSTATEEARRLVRESNDSAPLIEIEYLLAQADFESLKQLVEDHPRWIEDDEVRPKRNDLFHRCLDRFLNPHLFHPTKTEVAARGLYAAAELYHFAGEDEAAAARWEDLTKLYPETFFAAEAIKCLEDLSAKKAVPPPLTP